MDCDELSHCAIWFVVDSMEVILMHVIVLDKQLCIGVQ